MTVTGTGTFANKDAAFNKSVAITDLALAGADAGNYTLADTTANTTATINQKELTIASLLADNKEYDGTTAATFSNTVLGGLVNGENLLLTANGTFASKDAGTDITVNVDTTSVSLANGTNGLASNYTLDTSGISATTTANISAKELTIAGVTAASKVYDGTTSASLSTSGSLSGLVAGEDLELDTTGLQALFDDKNAGTGKTVTVTGYALADGTNGTASNYVLGSVTTTADIARATISAVSGIAAANKMYNGTIDATLVYTNASFAGLLGSDALTVTGTGTFADKNAGEGKIVNITDLVLGGADAGNYILADTTASTFASILPGASTQVVDSSLRQLHLEKELHQPEARTDLVNSFSSTNSMQHLINQQLITDNRNN